MLFLNKLFRHLRQILLDIITLSKTPCTDIGNPQNILDSRLIQQCAESILHLLKLLLLIALLSVSLFAHRIALKIMVSRLMRPLSGTSFALTEGSTLRSVTLPACRTSLVFSSGLRTLLDVEEPSSQFRIVEPLIDSP